MKDMKMLPSFLQQQLVPLYFRWWWMHWMRVVLALTVLGWAATLAAIGVVFCLAMCL